MIHTSDQVELEQFLSTVAQAPLSALLLDYDGTMAPFSTDRQHAAPYAGVTPLLQKIMASLRTCVVIITGRNASEVIPLLGIHPSPEVWGCHGLERMRPGGTCETSRLGETVLQALSEADHWLIYQGLRHLAEFKNGAVAVHWRGLAELAAAEVRDRVLLGWLPIAQRGRMELLEFDGGVEMRTPDPDKGDAVRTILDEIGPGVPTAYLGDDVTDEAAFRALRRRGLSVLVRPEWRKTAADLWLTPPDGLLDFLQRWLQACSGDQEQTADQALRFKMGGA